ncbi:hypothetical protein L1987_83106 [Smallanthus sonchifolius]|uniref:Uncharacterized protein n=1 Tax=Smallanthus sonchifolius TaxID=185202 RepID=A0ACB8YD17_9ASTR|nr:hypothetical protein L1987_83106 [Smallanthus sonchifolius]
MDICLNHDTFFQTYPPKGTLPILPIFMHKMNNYPLHHSLLDTTTVTTTTAATTTSCPPKSVNYPNTLPTVSDLISRLILISSFATVAIWANHEASKGFSITILNDSGKHSIPGRRFSIFYESNDKATRIVLNTSSFVETLLYPKNQQFDHAKKQINSVTLILAPKPFRRLNDGMRDVWHDGMMDDALGMAGKHACASYDIFRRHHHLSSSI